MNHRWVFHDAPNTACFTTTYVLDGKPILRVYHDYDGDWQFHSSEGDPVTEDDCKIVSLKQMVERDASLAELHNLPYGWAASRTLTSEPWERFKNNPFPSYSENGFYLEDAHWLSEFITDIHPPDEERLENLATGQYVKLVFRFAAEDAERTDLECERMWVQIAEIDEEGNFIGTLENEPHHQAAALGDVIHFHPLQIAEIDDSE